MKAIKFTEIESFEAEGIFEFADGNVTINEREIHECVRYGADSNPQLIEATGPRSTKLVIDDAIALTKDFVAKRRSEIGELNSILQELSVGFAKAN
jgi:hypothetical protein